MSSELTTTIEKTFWSLPRDERDAIIRHGVALRMSELNKRLFLAESKIRHFEEKYQTPLEQLESQGLPDDVGFEMHEDYIMWHHWTEVVHKTRTDIASLQEIAQHGIGPEEPHAGG